MRDEGGRAVGGADGGPGGGRRARGVVVQFGWFVTWWLGGRSEGVRGSGRRGWARPRTEKTARDACALEGGSRGGRTRAGGGEGVRIWFLFVHIYFFTDTDPKSFQLPANQLFTCNCTVE